MFNRSVLSITFALWLALISLVSAQLEQITQGYTQVCSGMYNRQDWTGNKDPFIAVSLQAFDGHKLNLKNINDTKQYEDGIILSVVLFEYKDIDYLGADLAPKTDTDDQYYYYDQKKYICDDNAIDLGLCTEKSKNKFIISKDAKNNSNSAILTFNLNKFGMYNTSYEIKNTGYYCVASYTPDSVNYGVLVNFSNSFGNLNAAEIPKLPLYGFLSLIYLVAFVYYCYNFYKYRKSITNIQKNLVFFTAFLIVENILIWFYYELKNNHTPYYLKLIENYNYWTLNKSIFIKFYLVFISVLNAFKVTFSFYLLLLIALGMGVVYPNLDKKLLLKCKIFAAVHFILTVSYIIANYLSNPEDVSLWILLPMIPLAITFSIFYYLILNALNKTTAYLKAQKQTIKLQIYKKLFVTIFASLLILLLGLVVSSFVFIGMSTTELIEQHWKSRFLIIDFWPSLVYLIIYIVILFIWRPTQYSYLLIVSTQVSNVEDDGNNFEYDQNNEFELNNLGNEFDINDDSDNDSFVGNFVNKNKQDKKKSELSKEDPENGYQNVGSSNNNSNDLFLSDDENNNKPSSSKNKKVSDNPFELADGDDDDDDNVFSDSHKIKNSYDDDRTFSRSEDDFNAKSKLNKDK
ncbi:uncharacterized protein ASCRUDRAFT_72882 [Ascoidea rubescens DSM 1968]|uniref:Membrane protein PTM1 n=1 Tax=Ascoidea rubescens DSM 1968 TaxID=1344418 RepID=A0A1D2V925_9ASCO|nr:hypothetical protein ASCRUDRAFT_72882 [Ascoidea rubescens DSM 1968]ODV58017.1 hypothetical protein ASCRUDRAFT_72882 [Ascoidea rubescens DSM 1968]